MDSPSSTNDGDDGVKGSRRPKDSAVYQQRLNAWSPVLDPVYVIAAYFILGVCFIPAGLVLQHANSKLVEVGIMYDDSKDNSSICQISSPNEGRICNLGFVVPEDMEPPIFVHYGLKNFYQNYNVYTKSFDVRQLKGTITKSGSSSGSDPCKPLRKLGDTYINPCGLIANTFFNDVFTLTAGVDAEGSNLSVIEKGIAWQSDVKYMYNQPDGFVSEECVSCDSCSCEGKNWSCEEPYKDEKGICHRYFYPEDDITQYLYETYPMLISPLEGVTNEHFIVWMRYSALQDFRKLYGYINQPINKGTNINFTVMANYEVKSFKGTKTLYLSTSNAFGGKNIYLGMFFSIVGYVSIALAVLFGIKHWISPRRLGDRRYLKFKLE